MINLKLLKPKVMKELSSGFAENNPKGVQVQGFMEPESYKKFLAAVAKAKLKKSEVRDTHSYFEADSPALKFFSSREFLAFAAAVTGKKIKKVTCSVRIFLKDCYTLMHDEKKASGIELFFDMTPQWMQEWGGSTVYLTDSGEKLILPPSPNSLIIAVAGKSYVKYVNHLAGNEGRLVVYGTMK